MTRAIPRGRARNEAVGIIPSTTEVAVYTLLGAAIASAVFVAGGRPYWHVAIVVLAALIIIVLSAISARRRPGSEGPDDTPAERPATAAPSTPDTARRGRRRRK